MFFVDPSFADVKVMTKDENFMPVKVTFDTGNGGQTVVKSCIPIEIEHVTITEKFYEHYIDIVPYTKLKSNARKTELIEEINFLHSSGKITKDTVEALCCLADLKTCLGIGGGRTIVGDKKCKLRYKIEGYDEIIEEEAFIDDTCFSDILFSMTHISYLRLKHNIIVAPVSNAIANHLILSHLRSELRNSISYSEGAISYSSMVSVLNDQIDNIKNEKFPIEIVDKELYSNGTMSNYKERKFSLKYRFYRMINKITGSKYYTPIMSVTLGLNIIMMIHLLSNPKK